MNSLIPLLEQLISVLTQLRDKMTPMETTVEPSLLDKFCLAIRDYEGAPGDANYKNNNPGNCRYYEGGYLPQYEPVYCSPDGFAIFPSMAVGMLYLENMVKLRIANHPAWTIEDFFTNYAPTSDGNNPLLYAAFVAKRLGVGVSYLIKNITA
jgi:hypothetical protein